VEEDDTAAPCSPPYPPRSPWPKSSNRSGLPGQRFPPNSWRLRRPARGALDKMRELGYTPALNATCRFVRGQLDRAAEARKEIERTGVRFRRRPYFHGRVEAGVLLPERWPACRRWEPAPSRHERRPVSPRKESSPRRRCREKSGRAGGVRPASAAPAASATPTTITIRNSPTITLEIEGPRQRHQRGIGGFP